MSKDFLDYYSDNLSFIRKSGAEFAKEYPKIASRLDISSLECQDPFIERLLEGTAFLSARVEKKLDDGSYRFLETLLSSLAPDVLSQIPSACVIKAQDGVSDSLNIIQRNTEFVKDGSVLGTTVKFESVFNTTLNTCVLDKAQFLGHDSRLLSLDVEGATASFSLSLSNLALYEQSSSNNLDLYLNLNDQDASALSELLFTQVEAVYVKVNNGNNSSYEYIKTDDLSFEYSILDEKEHVSLFSSKSLSGISLLIAFSAYPEFFKFIRLKGLGKLVKELKTNSLELVFVLKKQSDISLESRVLQESVLLNCIPLINLFSKRSDRVILKDNYEVNVSAQATSPLDYEISSISKLEFFNESNQYLFSAYPFFTTAGVSETENGEYRNFFSVNRKQRQSGLTSSVRSGYNKSECFVTVSGEDFKSHMSEELQFSAQCRCTNADLPLFISAKDTFSCQTLDKLKKLKLISNPTKPQNSILSRSAKDELKQATYLMQNFASMLSGGNKVCLDNLKSMISLFSTRKDNETANLVEALDKVEIENRVFRFISKGCVYFENGYNVRLSFSKKELEGVGFFVFSKVIASLLMSFTSINLPLNIELVANERGVVYSCKSLND